MEVQTVNKTGKMSGGWIAFWILIAVGVVSGLFYLGGYRLETPLSAAGGAGQQVVTSDTAACVGVSSVSLTYNDIDRYTPGTDPGVGNLFIVTDKKGSQAEGAITLSPKKSYVALAGQNATAYFAEKASFTTSCSAEDYTVDVVKAGAPTITFVNSDGVTKNSDTNDESMDASTLYSVSMKVKAPSQQCSARHGAVLVADFDKSFVQKVEFPTLSGSNAPSYLTHIDPDNGVADGFSAALYDGELCNAVSIEIPIDITTTSSTPDEGNATVTFHWLPRNFDINQDTFEILGPAVEDEDNNVLTLGNTTGVLYSD